MKAHLRTHWKKYLVAGAAATASAYAGPGAGGVVTELLPQILVALFGG